MAKKQMVNNKPLAERKCIDCGQSKVLTEFCAHRKAKDGYTNLCKACRSVRRYHNGDYMRERFRKHEMRYGSPTYYTDELIQRLLTATQCCYCGDKLVREKGHAKEPTTDHVYPGANIDDNIVICCRECNRGKFQSHVYDYYQSSERFTEELWLAFVEEIASRFLHHKPNQQEIESWVIGLKDEAEESRRNEAKAKESAVKAVG